MVFHENRLLASHEKSYLIFFRKLKKMSQNLLSAAVVIGALRVNLFPLLYANVSPMSEYTGEPTYRLTDGLRDETD